MGEDSTDIFPGPVIRDYLYVDLGRVRSLLTQIANGSPELLIERSQGVSKLQANINLGLLGVDGGRTRVNESEEQRSLTDLSFALFEQGAEAIGALTDVTDRVSDRADWFSGAVQAVLEEAQLIRVTGPVRLVDPVYFEESVTRLDKMIEAFLPFVGLSEGDRSGKATVPPTARTGGPKGRPNPARDKERKIAEAKAKLFGDTSPDIITNIRDVVMTLIGGGIAMRAMPCGEEEPECSFSGILLDRSNYIEPERSAIFNRFGARASTWTLVALVTRFGRGGSGDQAMGRFDSDREMSRIALEELVVHLLDRMEDAGVADGPSWPGIAVTPLALYRVLPTAFAPPT